MSKKKLAGIIVACVIAIIVVIVIATYSPENTKKPEQIAVSAYNLSEQLFSPQLTSLQKDTLWKEYEGKQVKWTSELKEVVSGKEGAVAYFLNPLDSGRSEIKAVFDESQSSNLSQCKVGDLVIYTGVLTSFGESSGDAEICLTDCAFVSIVPLVSLWWNGELRDTYSMFVTTDSDYVYAWVLRGFTRIPDAGYLWLPYSVGSCSRMTLDRVSGQIAGSDAGCDCYRWFPVKDLSKLTYEYEGVMYKSVCAVYGGVGTNCGTLQAIDQETGSVLWMMTFQQTGMNDFLIADGILYVSTDKGVGAFELPNLTELQNPNRSATGI
jgi:hypothetical protein